MTNEDDNRRAERHQQRRYDAIRLAIDYRSHEPTDKLLAIAAQFERFMAGETPPPDAPQPRDLQPDVGGA